MLLPKKVKHRKWHKGRRRRKGLANVGNRVDFGAFGMKAMDYAWLTSRQIEAARRTITRYLRKGGKIWIRIFPDKPRTRKGQEVPMGGGKGSPEFFVADIKPGRIIFELDGIPADQAKEAIRRAGHKLPLKVKFVERD